MNLDIVKVAGFVTILGVLCTGVWKIITTGTILVKFVTKIETTVSQAVDLGTHTLIQVERNSKRLNEHDVILENHEQRLATRRKRVV